MSGAEVRVIDCDVHAAPPPMQALFPYLDEYWREYIADVGYRTKVDYPYPDWSRTLRIPPDVDLEKVRRDVLEHSSLAVLQLYYAVEAVQHPYLAEALATAANRWLQTEWLDRDDRLLATAVITPQWPEAAVREIERIAADRRFVQVLLPARSREPYGSQRYWPIFEAAAEHGLAVALSSGASMGIPATPVGPVGSLFEEHCLAHGLFQTQLTSLLVGGVFDRFPSLKLVVMESGWTWMPSLLWRMDREWKGLRREVPWIAELPSHYIRRNVRLTTQPGDLPPTDGQLAEVLQECGAEELLMHATDYPHITSGHDRLVAGLGPEGAERVAWRNAWECYDIEYRLVAAS